MKRPLLITTCIIVGAFFVLPLFEFFPYRYLYAKKLPVVEISKSFIGYKSGVTVENGCDDICLRINILKDIDYLELYKDSNKFFRIEYDALTGDNDDDYVSYSLTNDDISTVAIDNSVGKSSWWGHLRTGEWIPLPGAVSLKNRHKFDMQLILSLSQVQKQDRIGLENGKAATGVVGIRIEAIPPISYTDNTKMVGIQKHIPWKISARTDKGVVNIADEVAAQDSHFSVGSWQND